MLKKLLLALLAVTLAASPAAAKPPLEAFGDVSTVRAMTLSPDGKRVAFIQRQDGEDILVIRDLATGVSKGLVKVGQIRARYVYFAGNDYVVLVASKNTRTMGVITRYEYSAAFAFNVTTGKMSQLLRSTPNLVEAQTGLGDIVGKEPDGNYVLMPAFISDPGYSAALTLLRVPLDSGRGMRVDGGRGNASTVDWLVDSQGHPVLREDFNEGPAPPDLCPSTG